MKYVIIGAGTAGLTAAKTIRKEDSSAGIYVISTDTYVHSRCMLHKYIAGERSEVELDFTEENFWDEFNINWMKGVRVSAVCPEEKKIEL